MTIKLTDDETMSKANNAFWGCGKTPSLDRLYAAASVFEAAANAQVGAISYEAVTTQKYKGSCGVEGDSHGQNGAPVTTFEVGKRYRTRGAGVATVLTEPGSLNGLISARYGGDGPIYLLTPSGKGCVDEGETTDLDLLPGAIDDEPANAAELTEYEVGHAILQAQAASMEGHGTYGDQARAIARRARELLSNDAVIANLDAMILETKAERNAWRDRALAAERQEDVVTCGFKVRAERAEGAIERVRENIELTLRWTPETDWETGCLAKAETIAKHLGLTITPARELTVTWEGAK